MSAFAEDLWPLVGEANLEDLVGPAERSLVVFLDHLERESDLKRWLIYQGEPWIRHATSELLDGPFDSSANADECAELLLADYGLETNLGFVTPLNELRERLRTLWRKVCREEVGLIDAVVHGARAWEWLLEALASMLGEQLGVDWRCSVPAELHRPGGWSLGPLVGAVNHLRKRIARTGRFGKRHMALKVTDAFISTRNDIVHWNKEWDRLPFDTQWNEVRKFLNGALDYLDGLLDGEQDSLLLSVSFPRDCSRRLPAMV